MSACARRTGRRIHELIPDRTRQVRFVTQDHGKTTGVDAIATARGDWDLEKWALMVRWTRDRDGWRELERLALLEADESRKDPRQILEWIGLVAETARQRDRLGNEGFPNDRAMRNLALLYGGASQGIAPVFALGLRAPE